jgi:hypothetical protein
MSIFVRFEGLPWAQRELTKLPKDLEGAVIQRLAQIAYDEAEAGAARHNRTGALAQSLFNRAVPGGREVGHDTRRAPQALFVNLGTRPHEIRPKDKKVLRWASGGRYFFSKFVKHPGYVGDPYLERAADAAVRQFVAVVDAALREADGG